MSYLNILLLFILSDLVFNAQKKGPFRVSLCAKEWDGFGLVAFEGLRHAKKYGFKGGERIRRKILGVKGVMK